MLIFSWTPLSDLVVFDWPRSQYMKFKKLITINLTDSMVVTGIKMFLTLPKVRYRMHCVVCRGSLSKKCIENPKVYWKQRRHLKMKNDQTCKAWQAKEAQFLKWWLNLFKSTANWISHWFARNRESGIHRLELFLECKATGNSLCSIGPVQR